MADLTVLEEKLAEVIGLAQAAQGATEKVEKLTDDEELAAKLQQMREEARETEERGTQYAEDLDGFEFLTMAEAGEVGHWSVLRALNETAGDQRLRELVEWALPIQERHFEEVKAGSVKLAGEEDPNSPA
jgi:hypothetical protein